MNDMNDEQFGEHFGEQVSRSSCARPRPAFQYPPTPDVASAVSRSLLSDTRPAKRPLQKRRIRLAWALVAVLVLLAVLAAVPQVRAAVVEFFQIGAIRLFVGEPTPTIAPLATDRPAAESDSGAGTPRL